MILFAIKTAFLVGIMWWYSMSIIMIINTYYGNELNDYLKINPISTYEKISKHEQVAEKTRSPLLNDNCHISQYEAFILVLNPVCLI